VWLDPTLRPSPFGALLVRLHHDLDPDRFIAATSETEAGYAGYLGTQLRQRDVVVLVAERDGLAQKWERFKTQFFSPQS
jgi:hypothetical protein